MKSPDLPQGVAGKWVLEPDGKLVMIITAELNAAMQQKPIPEQTLPAQTVKAASKDSVEVASPDGSTHTWTRTAAP